MAGWQVIWRRSVSLAAIKYSPKMLKCTNGIFNFLFVHKYKYNVCECVCVYIQAGYFVFLFCVFHLYLI